MLSRYYSSYHIQLSIWPFGIKSPVRFIPLRLHSIIFNLILLCINEHNYNFTLNLKSNNQFLYIISILSPSCTSISATMTIVIERVPVFIILWGRKHRIAVNWKSIESRQNQIMFEFVWYRNAFMLISAASTCQTNFVYLSAS